MRDQRASRDDAQAPGPPAHLLLLLLSAALIWRAALAFWLVPSWEAATRRAPCPDHYPSLAATLLSSGTLGYRPADGASPTTLRGPGFPSWVAAGILLGGEAPRWLGFWSSLPGVALAAAVLMAAWRRMGARAAALSFAIVGLHPLAGFLSARVMGDEFFAALCFSALLLWERSTAARPGERLAPGLASAICLSWAMLTRSSGLLFALALLAATALARPRRLGPAVLLVVLSLLLPLAWSVRSSRLEGRLVFVHSLGALNFWRGEAYDRHRSATIAADNDSRIMALIGPRGGIPAEQWRRFSYARLTPPESAALESRLRQEAIRDVMRSPARYAGRFARGLYRYWIGGSSPRRSLLYAVLALPVLGLAVAGALRLRRAGWGSDPMAIACAIAVILNLVFHAAINPAARYSMHVLPAMAWLAGMALQSRRVPVPAIAPHPRA